MTELLLGISANAYQERATSKDVSYQLDSDGTGHQALVPRQKLYGNSWESQAPGTSTSRIIFPSSKHRTSEQHSAKARQQAITDLAKL